VAVLLAAGWLAVRGFAADRRLVSAQVAVVRAQSDLLAGRVAPARLGFAVAAEDTSAAHGMTSDPVFALAAHLPLLGRPVKTVSGLAEAADAVAADVLPQLIDAGAAISGGGLLSAPGRVDLRRLAAAAPGLQAGEHGLDQQVDAVRRLPGTTGVAAVDRARAGLLGALSSLRTAVHSASVVATAGPAILGGQGARNYFVSFQNNAEVRATGGITGAFGILHADGGALSFSTIGSDADLRSGLPPVVAPNADVAVRYAGSGAGSIWQDVNLSSHFPYAGQTFAGLWERQTGQRLDGAFATDPVALSYLLAATGPKALPNGDVITAQNVVRTTLRDAYARYGDTRERKDYFKDVARATSDGVLAAPRSQSLALFLALKRATSEGRLLLWSANQDEQDLIASTGASGALPSTHHPVSLLALNNTTGQKVDYYLTASMRYRATSCAGRTRRTQVDYDVHNGAPAVGLPAYVVLRGGPDVTGPPGTSVYLASYYSTAGSEVVSAALDGAPIGVNASREEGLAVFGTRLVVPPGHTVTVHLELQEPVLAGSVATRPQPLVNPELVRVDAPVCHRVKG
jgi:hypothetical protein